MFGGAAQNPLRLLAKILGAMWDDNGRVTIPGFYDGVKELPADIKADLKGLDLTPEKFLGPIGLKTPAGEKDRMLIEQITTRPTAEINGIVGGYTGEGAKTVIPGQASAKVSFRLVGEQDPAKIRDAFRAFVKARLPADCRVEFGNFGLAPPLQLVIRQSGAQQGARRAGRGMGQEGGGGRRRRLDPDRRRFQERARHGLAAGRLRARRRPRAFAEREVRPDLLSQGHPVLGAHPAMRSALLLELVAGLEDPADGGKAQP